MIKVYIVGIGMGNVETLTIGARETIGNSHALIGARRMVDSFPDFRGQKAYEITPDAITSWISSLKQAETVSVVMSGDVGFFSGTAKLVQALEEKNTAAGERGEALPFQVELIPGISSVQYFCAKLKTSWEDARIVSLHGREGNAAGEVQTNEKTFFLTGSDHPVQQICKTLAEAGMGQVTVHAGERLSYGDEKITSGTAEALQHRSFDTLSVMLVENGSTVKRPMVSYGLEDEFFIRGEVPMTKAEVRSVTISKLHLKKDDCVYDIGAGTGSVSVELALAAEQGQVFAIENNPDGVKLIHENRMRLGAWNLHVVEGTAPEVMAGLPAPDKAFIGGTKGNMEAILICLLEKNPSVRVVINAIALESMAEAIQLLKKYEFTSIDVVQLSAARGRKAGSYHLMIGQNPVFIISGERS